MFNDNVVECKLLCSLPTFHLEKKQIHTPTDTDSFLYEYLYKIDKRPNVLHSTMSSQITQYISEQ